MKKHNAMRIYSCPQNYSFFSFCIILVSTSCLAISSDETEIKDASLHWTWTTTTDGLISNDICSMMVDMEGRIWIISTNSGSRSERYGISIFDGETFENLSGNELDQIFAVSQGQNGTIWYGFSGRGIAKRDGEYWERFYQRQGLIDNAVTCLFHDSSNNLWIGTNNGLSKYDGQHFRNFTDKDGLPYGRVNTINQDKEGNIWVGTINGVCKFDGISFAVIRKEDGLAHNDVLSILQDSRGRLLFGTLGGLSIYNGKDIDNFFKRDGLPDNHISCMVQDSAGFLWLGTHRGLSCYDGKTFTNYREKNTEGIDGGLIDDEISSMTQSRDGSLWIGTNKGVCRLIYTIK